MQKKLHKPGLFKFGLYLLIILSIAVIAVTANSRLEVYANKLFVQGSNYAASLFSDTWQHQQFGRAEILQKQKEKIAHAQPLVIHLLVPLCDNEHQGIVPVNESLGNGRNLTGNLYWGAMYGVKTWFRKKTDWKFISTEKINNEQVLERIIFNKQFPNGANVYLVADAYAGDKMKECLEDYFNALSSGKSARIKVGNTEIGIAGYADFLVFNGHNGLMDTKVSVPGGSKQKKDAAVIACMSANYFKDKMALCGGYPLLTTTNYMAPEAYVLESVFNAWALMKTPQEIRAEAGAAYNKYQKCGLKGATRLFSTGWD